jgi:hypothetical protein
MSDLLFPGFTVPWTYISGGAMVPPAFLLPGLSMQLSVPNPLPAFLLGNYVYRVRALGPGGSVMSSASFPIQLVL